MNVVKNIVRFLVLLILQVLLFNHLNGWGLCHPYIYIMALICMPLLPRWADMLVAFSLGLVMDMFCSSLGIHTAACVLIAYLRPLLLAKMVQDLDRVTQDVSIESVGLNQFVRLTVVLCLLHHAVVFLLDAGTLSHFWILLLRWMISSAITLLVILGYSTLNHD
ncbi:MAG: rod shape-determining protein MreD [Paludibacteraceae bacterium]|nr:rod shape-determining protein MreD [Paludibacteraceae bacterium]